MAVVDVCKAFDPAYKYMQEVLFRPFRMRTWLALGFVSLLAGGSGGGSGGGGNSNYSTSTGSQGSSQAGESFAREMGMVTEWIAGHMMLLVVGIVALVAVSLLFGWLGGVFKFVYLDQVIKKHNGIREPFARLKGLGTSFFLWQLGFGLVMMVALGVLIGLPLWAVFGAAKGGSVGVQALVVLWTVVAGIAWLLVVITGGVYGNDFVVPAMYVKGIRVLDGWRTVIPMLRRNLGQMALYLLLLIVIGIAAGIIGFIVMIPTLIVFALPGGLAAFGGYSIWQGAGRAFSPGLITYIASVGTLLLFALTLVYCAAMQPVLVFRRAYSLVVLGQADESMVTVPIGNEPPMYPPPPSYGG